MGPNTELFLYRDAADRATVGSFLGALGSLCPDDLCLTSIFVEFEHFRANLGTDSATDAFFLVDFYVHKRGHLLRETDFNSAAMGRQTAF